ncbi:lectin like domain-containing protein [Methanococcoides methylutens]|uniref:PKD domain-containing protein n=1 Tax=Methanococcoides methylutens MM1 TaxID=1434104 RepID=A0A0E3SS10_METMT|nr:lectin like domain-containing protein [Methanococcoides methylutens]AKB85208.1 hypothetical protein MCMEM_1155 [Methanococcoides methylutens MM1]
MRRGIIEFNNIKDGSKAFLCHSKFCKLSGIAILLVILALTGAATAATINMDDVNDASGTIDEVCTQAPVNPEFIKYQMRMNNQLKMRSFEMSPEGHKLGYIPSPVDLSHIEENAVMESDSEGFGTLATITETYPSYYDLRDLDKVTSVKNQGAAGSCWAHATYASLESYLITSETHDFSENNMKNLLNNWPNSPYQERFDFVEGGNAEMSTAYLARWSGPIDESDDPYSSDYGESPSGLSEQKHVQEVLWLTSMDDIKDAVMNNGAVQTSFYWDNAYYNATDHSYYYAGSASINHAVAIVGWDDDFTSSGFPGTGAYIIKNSWGTNWGDGGYFYLSYSDTYAGDYAVIFTAEETDNYDSVYQYDPLGWVSSAGYGSTTAWGANVFTAEADETLEAVSFYTTDIDTQYEIYVYLDPMTGSPTNSAGEVATKSGTFSEAGYHTVHLDSDVQISSGQDFSVVIKFTTSNDKYPVAMERPYSDYSSKATANAGESYISSSGSTWSDITSTFTNTNVCIKAFTSSSINENNFAPVLDAIGDKTVDELTELTFTATAADDDIPVQTLTFSLAGDVPQGAEITTDGVFTWTPTEVQGLESYNFDVVVSDGALTDSETITVTVNEINVAPVLDVIGDQTVEKLAELTFTATATDADIPVQTLEFSLAGTVPQGAAITPAGVFTWTPAEEQGPDSYNFDVVVSDGELTDSETITITVNEVNVAPVLDTIGDKTVNELTELTFTATATDSDIPVQELTFSLAGDVPQGAEITPAGVFTWTPTEMQGPASYNFDVVVFDGALTDNETITITVDEVNVAPVLDTIGDKTVNELTELTFTATATDSDIPVQELTFSLAGDVPQGAEITPAGVFTWTPTEEQGPGSYNFDIVVFDGIATDSEIVLIDVSESSNPPIADFTSDITRGKVPLTVQFVDQSSGATSWSWDIDGDGIEDSNAADFSYTYTTPGTYSVSLTVTNSDGEDTETKYDYVKVLRNPKYTPDTPPTNNPPVADAGGPYAGDIGEEITFVGSGSYDTEGTIASYEWDFGDGTTPSVSTLPNTTHTYTVGNIYTATLTVTDSSGVTATDTVDVMITDPNAVAGDMSIESIILSTSTKQAGKNFFVSANAVVKISDGIAPVAGATVTGQWSGAANDMDTGTTNADGEITFTSDSAKYTGDSITFYFTVNGVTHQEYVWDGTPKSAHIDY